MSFDAMLDHRVHIERRDESGEDSYGQAVTTDQVGQVFAAALQPKTVREVAAIAQGGVSVGDWTIFMRPRQLSTADAIVHDTDQCPKADGADFPTMRFELTGIRNPGGRGHHFECDARSAGVPDAIEG